jgi:threonine synthase
MPYRPDLDFCDHCGGFWLDAQYDYDRVAELWRSGLTEGRQSLWRYRELLPPVPEDFVISMGEGTTPLFRAKKLQTHLGHPTIFIKDERQLPTNSFKDRQGSVAISVLSQRGIKECVLASTGNAAVAYAAYSAWADIKLWVFLTSLVPSEKMREVALYGAEVIKVTGTYDEAKKVASDFARRRNLYLDKGAKAIAGKESMKTLAYEIAEQFARFQGKPGTLWQAPDWYIQAVSGGIGPLGVLKGFTELYQMGLIDRIPKIGVVQTAGCAPMVRSMTLNQKEATPVVPKSRIVVLSTGNPGLTYNILRQAQLKNGGAMVSVTDEEAFAAMRRLARTQGVSVEPATAVAFAGLKKFIQDHTISSAETVVINCSGHTFPVEKHIMDDQMVLDMKLTAQTKSDEKSLVGALEHLEEQITSLVIIDDNPLDRLLVRRVLQDNKPYRCFEASSGPEGLELVEARQPDLIILDLNMPEMDGFTVLDRLKENSKTAHIPVVVVSAKELEPTDKKRLEGKIASIWQKGSFSTRTLMSHLVKTIQATDQLEPNDVIEALSNIDQSTSKIVIIDDEPDDIRLLKRILESQQKYDIYEANSGQEGLAVIKAQNPDLIILDLIMPDMDGFEVMDRIKTDRDLRKIPIIVISGKELSVDQQMQLGDTASVLQKSKITVESLVSQVDSKLS